MQYLAELYGRLVSIRTLTKGKYRLQFEDLDCAIRFVNVINDQTNMHAEYELADGASPTTSSSNTRLASPALPAVKKEPVQQPQPPVANTVMSLKDELARLLASTSPTAIAKLAQELAPTEQAPAEPAPSEPTPAPQPEASDALPGGTKVFVNPSFDPSAPPPQWEEGEVWEGENGVYETYSQPHVEPVPVPVPELAATEPEPDAVADKLAEIESLIASIRKPEESSGTKRTRDEMEGSDPELEKDKSAYLPPHKRPNTKVMPEPFASAPQEKRKAVDDPAELSWRKTMKAPSDSLEEPAMKKIRVDTKNVSTENWATSSMSSGSPPFVVSIGTAPDVQMAADERFVWADQHMQPVSCLALFCAGLESGSSSFFSNAGRGPGEIGKICRSRGGLTDDVSLFGPPL